MQTRYHSSYLTDGCWSPTRAGLFYLTRMDGFLDVWDFFYRQNEVAYSQKVSDAVLTSIQMGPGLLGVGDSDGTVSMLRPSNSLQQGDPKEKELMVQVFDREFRREKQLEVQKRLADKGKPKGDPNKGKDKIAAKLEARLKEIEESFFNVVAENENAKEAIKARGATSGDNNENEASRELKDQ